MSDVIFYDTTQMITPDKINVKIDDTFFNLHEYNLESFEKLVDTAKQIPEIMVKKVTGNLTEEERKLYNIFIGDNAPDLELSPEGDLYISNGRHRMQAIKLAKISLPMRVSSYAHIEPVKDISNIYPSKIRRFFRKKEEAETRKVIFILAKTTIENIREIDKKGYFINELHDEDNEDDYVFVSKEKIANDKEFSILVKELNDRKIPLYITSEHIYQKYQNMEETR